MAVGVVLLLDGPELESAELGPAPTVRCGCELAVRSRTPTRRMREPQRSMGGLRGEELFAEDEVAADVLGLGGGALEDFEGEVRGLTGSGRCTRGRGDVAGLGEDDGGPEGCGARGGLLRARERRHGRRGLRRASLRGLGVEGEENLKLVRTRDHDAEGEYAGEEFDLERVDEGHAHERVEHRRVCVSGSGAGVGNNRPAYLRRLQSARNDMYDGATEITTGALTEANIFTLRCSIAQ